MAKPPSKDARKAKQQRDAYELMMAEKRQKEAHPIPAPATKP